MSTDASIRRNQPQIPDQIAQNIAHLEIGARSPSIPSELPSPIPMNGGNSHARAGELPAPGSNLRPSSATDSPRPGGRSPGPPTTEEPSFSVFPVVRNREMNVPPSDEEKENILETARESVLNSNDPEMQLAWAQDSLVWVEIAQQNEQRMAEFRPARSQTPKAERRLRVDAINIVDFLAQQNHPKAEFLKGTWLEFGRFGFDTDKREAFRCYSRSANNGYARSQYRMGMQFEGSSEIEKAVRHYNYGVHAGDAASSYRMGMMYLLGQNGQTQDFNQAIELIKFSAENADENAPQGAYVYGMLYVRELNQVQVPEHLLPYDIDAGRVNIEKAAYLGFAKAQVKMGSAYELSELNCRFDPVLSLHYNNLAARQGEPEAEMAISKWFLSGYEGVFPKNEGMAFLYAQRAASSGLPTAEFAMGYFYEVGIHVQTSLKEARAWYSKSADHGNKDASGRIDGISRSKTLSRKDHDKVAMARLKSQRGNNNPSRQGHHATPSVSMPQMPGYGESYAAHQPAPPYGQSPYPDSSQGHPYGPQTQYPPQPRPSYGVLAPPPGPGYPLGVNDRPHSAGPGVVPGPGGPPGAYGRPIPGRGAGLSPMGSPAMGYASQIPSAQAPRPVSGGYPQGPVQGRPTPQGAVQNRIPSGPAPRPSPSPLLDIGFSAPPDYGRRMQQAGVRPGAGRGGSGRAG